MVVLDCRTGTTASYREISSCGFIIMRAFHPCTTMSLNSLHSNLTCILDISAKGGAELKNISLRDLWTSLSPEVDSVSGRNNLEKLNLKDLLRLNHKIHSGYETSAILVRQNAVVIGIDRMRSVITSDRLIFFVPSGADSMLVSIEASLKNWDAFSVPFEWHAIDSVMRAVMNEDIQRMALLSQRAQEVVEKLAKRAIMSLDTQDKLRRIKFDIPRFVSHAEGIHQSIAAVVSDEDVNETFPKQISMFHKPSESFFSIESASDLFEICLAEYSQMLSNAEMCADMIRNAEESENLRLDLARNQLLIVNIVLSVLTCAIGFCAYVTGIFGMNLDQTLWLQDVYGVFTGVVISTLLFMVIVGAGVVYLLMYFEYVPC